MTPRAPQDPGHVLRDDLGAVAVDGDIVVYDAVAETAHILSGGAVAVWIALEDEGEDVRPLTQRVAELVGVEPDAISDEVEKTVASFDDRGFLDRAARGNQR